MKELRAIVGDPKQLAMLVLFAVAGLWLAKLAAKQLNRPDYVFI